MSEQNSSISIKSMNSFMQAISGDHRTEYIPDFEEYCIEQIPDFMQFLIDRLIQLCVTQQFAENIKRTLSPWIKSILSNKKNPRLALVGFFQDFLRLFNQQTQKIAKYGQKKLKYLIQTVSKQIFTQIIRISCVLKLQNENRLNYQRVQYRKINNIIIFIFSIERYFKEYTNWSFKNIKKYYFEEIDKEDQLVQKFNKCTNLLEIIVQRKNRDNLWKGISLWRKRNMEISQEQTMAIYQYAKEFYQSILPNMVKCWNSSPYGWATVVTDLLQNLVGNIGGASQGTVIEFIPNQKPHQCSLDYSALSSYRSQLSRISSTSLGECLKTDEIKYDKDHRLVVIPIIAQEQIGIIKISWVNQLPIIFFNKILKLVELLKSIILQFAKISTRLTYYNLEYSHNEWNQRLFQLAFKEQVLQPKQIQSVITATNVKFLEIYHDRQNPTSCIKYATQNIGVIPENIYKLIWEKLQTTTSFELDRENLHFFIMKLQNEQGFCRYAFEANENIHDKQNQSNEIIVRCLISLMIKNLGKIGCSICNITVKQCIPPSVNKSIELQKQRIQVKLDSKYVMLLKNSRNVSQSENYIYQLVKNSFSDIPLFARVFYPICQGKCLYVYRNKKKEGSKLTSIEIPKSFINENFCTLQWGQTDKILLKLIGSLHANPLFQDSEVYLYQNEKKNKMKVVTKKIGRRAILVISTYAQPCQNLMLQTLKMIGSQLLLNTDLFSKEDIYSWSSTVLNEKQALSFQGQSINTQLLNCIDVLDICQLFARLCKILNKKELYYVWKVKNNKVSLIASTIKQNNDKQLKLPYEYLISQAIQSHQGIKGCHRTIRVSKSLGNKLEQLLSYIPNFQTAEQRLEFAEMVYDKMEGEAVGELADPCYNAISSYLAQVCLFDKYYHQFVSVPVNYRGSTYIFMMIFNRQCYISASLMQAISSVILRIVPIILQYKYHQMKVKALSVFSQFGKQNSSLFKNRINNIKDALYKFNSNYILNRNRNTLLQNLVIKMKCNQMISEVRCGFGRIKKFAVEYKQLYEKNCQVLVKRIIKILGMSPFLKKMQRYRCHYKGATKLYHTIEQIIRYSTKGKRVGYQSLINLLKAHNSTKMTIVNNCKYRGFKKVSILFNRIYKCHLYHFFNKESQNQMVLQRSLRILHDQFRLLEPKSMKSCLQFLTARLNLMLTQFLTKSILLQIINHNFSHIEPNPHNLIPIQNSKLSILITNDGQILNKNIYKYVETALSQILPTWQHNYHQHQLHRIKILYRLLDRYRIKNTKYIFQIQKSQHNKENIQQLINIKKSAIQEKQKMRELETRCNVKTNLQSREKHKKQVEQIKYDIGTVTNSLHQVIVQAKIKSKTNATYRMLSFINKKNIENYYQYKGELVDGLGRNLKEVKKNTKEQRFSFFCQTLPLWVSTVQKTKKNIYIRYAQELISLLQNYQD